MKKTYILSLVFVTLVVVGIATAITMTRQDNGTILFAPEKASVPNIGFVYLPMISRTLLGSPSTVNTGVIITEVLRNSPAERAGLRPGDMILSYNGTRITQEEPLFGVMRRCAGGTTIEIEVLRENITQTYRLSCPAQ